MRKLISILLLVMYGFTVSGASVHIHYCMDEFSNIAISLSGEKSESCGFCGMQENEASGCCEEQIQKVEADKDQLQKSFQYSFKLPADIKKVDNLPFEFSLQLPLAVYYPISKSPPTGIPFTILHCTYRI